jgi:hypothetical protein
VPFDPQPRLYDSYGNLASAEESGVKVAHSLGADGADALAKLRSIPAEKLINANMLSDTIVDGWVVTDQPLALFARGGRFGDRGQHRTGNGKPYQFQPGPLRQWVP